MRKLFARRDARSCSCATEAKAEKSLWKLCKDGKLDEVRSALARGEDVNDKDSDGITALMWAVRNKHNSIVKLLLDQQGVKTNEKDIYGLTALHCAPSRLLFAAAQWSAVAPLMFFSFISTPG